MKRFDQKVKDIVEVRPSLTVGDFLADLSASVDSYHFTDITSDLMGKWLDYVADLRKGSGLAVALAGFRGVGKSHFLASLAAIISHPELRNKVPDQHVANSSERLQRRQIPIVFVRRGSAATLMEELRTG